MCSGEPRTGDSAPCANTQLVDMGAKPATAMLKKASHNSPSPSNVEGEVSKHQEATVWCVHGSRRRFATIYCICVERWWRMCGILGARGLNTYTQPLNKHWVHLLLAWQSTHAQLRCSIPNALRKWFNTHIFSWCKLALEILRDLLVCAKWGQGL